MPFISARQLQQELVRPEPTACEVQCQPSRPLASTFAASAKRRSCKDTGIGSRGDGRVQLSLRGFAVGRSSIEPSRSLAGSNQSKVITIDLDISDEEPSIRQGHLTINTELVGRQFQRDGNQLLLARAKSHYMGDCCSSVAAELELGVEREPNNKHDPFAILVRERPESCGEPCGHIPRNHAAVLSPLLEQGSIRIVSATTSASQVIKLSAFGLCALPVLLHLAVSETATAKAASVRGRLLSLPALVGKTREPSASVDVKCTELWNQTLSRSQNRSSQQSLLMNFGRGSTPSASSSASSRSLAAHVIVRSAILTVVGRHLGVVSLLVMRWASSDLRRGVDIVPHLRCRTAVERFVVRARCNPLSAASSIANAIAAVVPLAAAHWQGRGGLAYLVEATGEWALSELFVSVVRETFLKREVGPPWVMIESFLLSNIDDRTSGWCALAALIWLSTSACRMAVLRAALTCVCVNELRELVAFLVLLSAPEVSPEVVHTERGRVSSCLRRLHRDLLVCNRFLEGAGTKLPVIGLHMPNVSLTQEQELIIVKSLSRNELLLISAYAGTGKTSTLRMYALMRPQLQILYLCFNVSVREEAQRTFPKNVICKNIHQLAYAAYGHRYQKKLAGDDLRAEDLIGFGTIDALLSSGQRVKRARKFGGAKDGAEGTQLEAAECCLATLRGFLNSADAEITAKHLPRPRPVLLSDGTISEESMLCAAEDLWRRMCDRSDTQVRMTHAGYLKLYSLSKPPLRYDLILLDEAQDCNPAIACVVTSQVCARILVGDEHQAIYGFLGAQDMLTDRSVQQNQLNGSVVRRQLTNSFRFGHNIADVANFFLHAFLGAARPVLGCNAIDGEILPPMEDIGLPQSPYAFIARSNITILMHALRSNEAGLSLDFVGGVKSYKLGLVRDLCFLAMGERGLIQSGRVRYFHSLAAVKSFAKRVDDRELVARIELVARVSPQDLLTRLSQIEESAERRERAQVPQRADVILSTVHKAKGLEWDTVVVASDFIDVASVTHKTPCSTTDEGDGARMLQLENVQELNMLYVAITRTKRRLQLPSTLYALYHFQAEAIALVAMHNFEGACPSCGDKLIGASRNDVTMSSCSKGCLKIEGHFVGSVNLRRFCDSCLSKVTREQLPDKI